MSARQRSTPFFSKSKHSIKSLRIQHTFHNPKFLRPASNNKIQSASKCLDYLKEKIQSHHSTQFFKKPLLSHPRLPTQKSSQGAHSHKKKGKEDDLRETDDSVRPRGPKKKLSINNFIILRQLGKGKHGIVFLAMHKETGFIGALKVFNKKQFQTSNIISRQKLEEELVREIKIQLFANHQYIIKLYSIFADNDCVYAFMELGSDGQLYDTFQRSKKLKEETISFINRSLLDALSYLHSNGIIHRDIKPQNIVLIHGFPKICDFGQSNFFSREKGELRETLCGTPLYLSPEILIGDKYDEKIDIWALGAMAYELFTAMNPFDIKNKDELKRIITDQFKMRQGSIQICNFLSYCLKKDPKERPNSSKLLKHPFITKWKQLQTSQQLCYHP